MAASSVVALRVALPAGLWLALLTLPLAGCGQKGSLTVPPPATAASAPAAR